MAKAGKMRARIVKSFTDAGTGKRFAAGKVVQLTAGQLANYQAAGLVQPVKTAGTAARAAPSIEDQS
jgi:hypothetical protein